VEWWWLQSRTAGRAHAKLRALFNFSMVHTYYQAGVRTGRKTSRAVRARPFSSAPDSTSLVGGRATAASRMLLSFSFYYSGGSLAKLLPFIVSKEKLLPFFLFFFKAF